MNLDSGQDNDLNKILAIDMQDLDTIRHNYETKAQGFSREHDIVATVVLAGSIVLVLSGFWWMSIFVFLVGVLVIYILKMKKLAAERLISQVDREIRQKSLEILSNVSHKLY